MTNIQNETKSLQQRVFRKLDFWFGYSAPKSCCDAMQVLQSFLELNQVFFSALTQTICKVKKKSYCIFIQNIPTNDFLELRMLKTNKNKCFALPELNLLRSLNHLCCSVGLFKSFQVTTTGGSVNQHKSALISLI